MEEYLREKVQIATPGSARNLSTNKPSLKEKNENRNSTGVIADTVTSHTREAGETTAAASILAESTDNYVHLKSTDQPNKKTGLSSKPDNSEISSTTKKDPFIDLISIGSLLKKEYQNAQERTFGSHPKVRNYFRITELNDTDATCYKNLTMTQLGDVLSFCKDSNGNQSLVSSTLRRRVFSPKNHTGWLCAQKRPVDGLHLALQKYKSEPLPSYLFIIDDDSYINVNASLETLQSFHPEEEPHVVSGCRYNYPQTLHFTFPYGGFGSILTRKAIENLVQPIHCNAPKPDDFTRSACWRLDQNIIDEKQFFREGMSVADLMFSYSSGLPFTTVDKWKNRIGYCFHSDHFLGYFLGFYHIAVPDEKLSGTLSDSLRKEYGYRNMGDINECKNQRSNCKIGSSICHYIGPRQMSRLFAQQV